MNGSTVGEKCQLSYASFITMSYTISFPEPPFPLTSRRKMRALGATILFSSNFSRNVLNKFVLNKKECSSVIRVAQLAGAPSLHLNRPLQTSRTWKSTSRLCENDEAPYKQNEESNKYPKKAFCAIRIPGFILSKFYGILRAYCQ